MSDFKEQRARMVRDHIAARGVDDLGSVVFVPLIGAQGWEAMRTGALAANHRP